MNSSPALLVFTDLDGTLIDHDTYRWDAAVPALQALAQIGAGVILASSKTAAEISLWQRQLDLIHWPAIVENGSGVLSPDTTTTTTATATARPNRYDELRSILNSLPGTLRKQYQGFGDMTVDTVSATTGLSVESAALAKTRAYSEPGLWTGNAADRDEFIRLLQHQNVSAREGGRFLTLSFGQTKADCMSQIITRYNPQTTIALGDAPNDVEMLQAADIGIIVANPHREPLPTLAGEASGRIIRTALAGPHGWNDAILRYLTRFDSNQDT